MMVSLAASNVIPVPTLIVLLEPSKTIVSVPTVNIPVILAFPPTSNL